MALGGGTDLRMAESVPATARAVRKTGRYSRGIPILGLHPDLLEFSVGRPVDEFSGKIQQTCAMLHRLTLRGYCAIPTHMPTPGETRAVTVAEGYLPGAAEWKAASFALPAFNARCSGTKLPLHRLRGGRVHQGTTGPKRTRTQEPRSINARKISVNARALQHVIAHRAIQSFSTRGPVRR